MLPEHFRFVVDNFTGTTIHTNAVALDYELVKGDGSGGQSVTDVASTGNGSSLANSASQEITTDSAAGNIGVQGFMRASTSQTSADGDVELWFELSTDGGTKYRRPGDPVAIVNWSGATSDARSFQI